jgi:hypothetical protein
MLRRVTACCAVLSAIATTSDLRAENESCGSTGRPWVAISDAGTASPEVVSLLRAELAARQIELCSEGNDHRAGAIATIELSPRAEGASIVVEVRDRLTAKRVSRDLDLTGVPPDGRALTLAVAADELLRASWAELALTNAPAPSSPVPAAVTEALRRDLEPWQHPRIVAGVAAIAVGDTWGGSATFFGADLRATAWLSPRVGAELRLGFRDAPSATAPDGEVHATALLAGLGASLRTLWSPRHGLYSVVRLDAARISFAPMPNSRSVGSTQAETTLLAGAGLGGWVVLGSSARLLAEVLGEVPLRPVLAADAGRRILAVSGVGLEGGIGLGVFF